MRGPGYKIVDMKRIHIMLLAGFFICSCNPARKASVDISPYQSDARADSVFNIGLSLSERSFDMDSTVIAMEKMKEAIRMDSNNPLYYSKLAKLESEMGELDNGIELLKVAEKKNAIRGDGFFQLGLLYDAEDDTLNAKNYYQKCLEYQDALLSKYPDSLGAFVIQQTANALMNRNDSLYMQDIDAIRKIYKNRLLELEMVRRLKPRSIVNLLKSFRVEKNQINYNQVVDSISATH